MTRDEDCYHDFNLECSLSEVFVQHVVFFIHCKNSEQINTLRVSFHVHTQTRTTMFAMCRTPLNESQLVEQISGPEDRAVRCDISLLSH